MGAKEKLDSNEVKLKIILFEIGEEVTGEQVVDVCLFGPSISSVQTGALALTFL